MTNIKIMFFDSSLPEINMFIYQLLSLIQIHIVISRDNDKLPHVTGMWVETSNNSEVVHGSPSITTLLQSYSNFVKQVVKSMSLLSNKNIFLKECLKNP